MSLYDTKLAALDGTPDVLASEKGKVTLLVNVASFCGLTPQYEGLQQLEEKYRSQGFDVIGIPCNQFGEQEPGSPEEIKTFKPAIDGALVEHARARAVPGSNWRSCRQS